jgi:hypothetical protein
VATLFFSEFLNFLWLSTTRYRHKESELSILYLICIGCGKCCGDFDRPRAELSELSF